MHNLTGVRIFASTEVDPCAMCGGGLNTREIVIKGRITLCKTHIDALRVRITQLNEVASSGRSARGHDPLHDALDDLRERTMITKMYLGDSVYVDYDGYMLQLTTENNMRGPSNTIYLEPRVYEALLDYVRRLKETTQSSD